MGPTLPSFNSKPTNRRRTKQKKLLIIPATLLLVFLFSSSSLATPAALLTSKLDSTSSTSNPADQQSKQVNRLDWSKLFYHTNPIAQSNQAGQPAQPQGQKHVNQDSTHPSSSSLFHNSNSNIQMSQQVPQSISSSHFPSISSSSSHSHAHAIHQISRLPHSMKLHLLSPSRIYNNLVKAMGAGKGAVTKAGSAARLSWPQHSSSTATDEELKPWQSYGALYSSFKLLLKQAYRADPEHPFSRPIVAAILSFLIFFTLRIFELGPCKPTPHQLQVRALLAHQKSLRRGRSPFKKPLGRSPSSKRRSDKEEPSLLPSTAGNGSYAEMTQNTESLSHCLAARLCRARARSEAKRQKEQQKAEEAMKDLAWAENQQQLQQEQVLMGEQHQTGEEEEKKGLEAPMFVRLPSWTDKGPVPLTVSAHD